ncbi:NAD-dependent epimerase/dehydratase family protein [Nocardia sp. SYP-A9097]|uniref:NAD-dependent epimerase/dehydratase family protein n=1 Tax=Nocardia sp. SYP-A9097 TaxID=2663237 RepID=UPI0013298A0B|nr:NAD-dependent epimerase/dehydratase family protein [Nocardia sp. SYP-A9097]MRH92274.1 NAD-dependent epimerase/dehydratase family protein [Nocardia sp. SYP-A9097]
MRALITGGAGFIGSHLLDRLVADGHQVSVIDNLSSGDKSRIPDTVTLHVVDIRDAAAVTDIVTAEKPSVIYHLAAQISVRHSVTEPRFDAETNVLGTLNLIEAARAVSARIIMASTGGAMYGDGVPMPTPETQLPKTQAPYGISKYCAEQYLSLNNRLYGANHLSLRLGNAYGPRQDPHGEAGVVAIFCGLIARGQTPTIFGDGTQTRDYVYVADVVQAFLAATTYTGTESVLNIGTGKGTSVLELLDAVNQAAGTTIIANHAPARAGEWKHGALDSALATKELGWSASTTITDGIRHTYEQLTA